MTFDGNDAKGGQCPVLWITKSHHDFSNGSLLHSVESLGMTPWHFPLVEIDTNIDDNSKSFAPPLSDIGGVIFTSVHGVDGFLKKCYLQKISELELDILKKTCPMYAVGQVTSSYLKHLGFQVVFDAKGTYKKLINTISYHHIKDEKKVFYARGVHVTNSLGDLLSKLGFETVENIVYNNTYIDELSPKNVAFLQQIPPWGITIQSMKTAQTFVFILEKYKMLNVFSGVHVFCFSSKMANYISERTPVQVHVIKDKNQENLIKTISQVLEIK